MVCGVDSIVKGEVEAICDGVNVMGKGPMYRGLSLLSESHIWISWGESYALCPTAYSGAEDRLVVAW